MQLSILLNNIVIYVANNLIKKLNFLNIKNTKAVSLLLMKEALTM